MAATILIVEDEHAVARGLQYALEQEGYEVTLARSGEEGLEVATREAPGLPLVGGSFMAIPPLLPYTKLRGLFAQLGFVRYNLLMNLVLFMGLLPIKMVLRWTLNLKYLIAIPNYNL